MKVKDILVAHLKDFPEDSPYKKLIEDALNKSMNKESKTHEEVQVSDNNRSGRRYDQQTESRTRDNNGKDNEGNVKVSSLWH